MSFVVGLIVGIAITFVAFTFLTKKVDVNVNIQR